MLRDRYFYKVEYNNNYNCYAKDSLFFPPQKQWTTDHWKYSNLHGMLVFQSGYENISKLSQKGDSL